MNKWLRYEDYPDTTDGYCWAEIRREGAASHTSYVTMAYWWEGFLYNAIDGANVSYGDRFAEERVIGVMVIDQPKPTLVYDHASNIRHLPIK